jgi:hypothetical protein
MLSTARFLTPVVALVVGAGISGCDSAAPPSPIASDTAVAVGLRPCELLSNEQVASAVPAAAAGMTVQAGGSLIDGVDAYQCSYSNDAGDLLTVILNVAVDDARYADIAPSSAVRDNRERVDAGDEGWLSVASDEVRIKAAKNRTVIDLELTAAGAADKVAVLLELTRAVATKID